MNACIRPGHLPHVVLAALLAAAVIAPAAASGDALELLTAEAGPVPTEAGRDVPSTVWFQGFLADSSTGDPINATYIVVARIYSLASGGSLLWGPETHSNTSIVEGWFNIELGKTVSPLPSFATPPYYLELVVNGETLSPRSKLASVPSALRASATVADDGDWTIAGDDIHRATGNVAVGSATTTDAKLYVYAATATAPALRVHQLGGSGSWPALYVRRDANVPGVSLLSLSQPENSNEYIHCYATHQYGFYTPFYVSGRGYISGNGSAWIYADSDGSRSFAVRASSPAFGNDTKVVYAQVTGANPYDAIAVYGQAVPQDRYGYGGVFEGGYVGAEARVDGTGTGIYYGLYGIADTPLAGTCFGTRGYAHGEGTNYALYGAANSGNTNYGVRASASGTATTNYGIYSVASGATTNYAGYFSGNVHVSGNHTVTGTKAFKIDHPLDPAGKYLVHSCVESPDMMNIYNGSAVLDGAGESWVELPEWFEALNRDFRYQLTAVGAPGPNLFVAQKVSGNRFRIAGGEPGMEVSWQVTGVRRDAYAEANPIAVEIEKPEHERGRFLHPELYGLPASEAIGAIEDEPEPERRVAPDGNLGN